MSYKFVEWIVVTVNDEVISSIGQGLCVLIGISRNDTIKDTEYMQVKFI